MRLPLYIEVKGKNILVIGGGREGTRRAKKFFNAGANVKVLSLEFSDELLKFSDSIELIHGDAGDHDLLEKLIANSYIVVVALSTKKLNKNIIEVAKKYGVMVNLTNDAVETEVVVPFETMVDGLRIAMTSEGKSDLVVKEALKRVVNFLHGEKEIFYLLDLMWYLKKYMKSNGIPFEIRRILYHEVFDDSMFRKLALEGRSEDAKERLKEIVRVRVSGKS